jgi:CheY-like chemotaxis protein
MKPAHAILLVEDNPADIKITERALRDSGFPVELLVVRDGQEAVDYLLRQGNHAATAHWRKPDLILLDLNLPGIDGWQVLTTIKTHPYLRCLPVVILTTSRREEDVLQTYQAGANTYIQKPAEYPRYRDLVRTLRQYWQETAIGPPHHRPRS